MSEEKPDPAKSYPSPEDTARRPSRYLKARQERDNDRPQMTICRKCGDLMVAGGKSFCPDCVGERSETREPSEAQRISEGFEMMNRDGHFG